MKRVLLVIPGALCAVACLGIIVLAAPLLALLGRPRRNDEQRRLNMGMMHMRTATGIVDVPQWMRDVVKDYQEAFPDRRVEPEELLGVLVEHAPDTSTLEKERDEAVTTARTATERLAEVVQADTHLSELHIRLRQIFGAESIAEALETAATLKKRLDAVEAEGIHRAAQLSQTGKRLDDALRDAKFFKERAGVASEEIRDLEQNLKTTAGMLADSEAQLEALQIEVAMLEAHVDCIDDALPGSDVWSDWDLEVAEEPVEETSP